MDLAPQQVEGLQKIREWHKNGDSQVFRLFGYAGTGKTTLARVIEQEFTEQELTVRFAAFTGKAAHVLRTKGVEADTIHGLIYKLVKEQNRQPIFRLDVDDSPLNWTDLLVLDEVSMVNEEIGNDLLSFGKKILVLGDPGQLPPVSGTGFFTAQDPDFLLTDIHRQAQDSPIIQLATQIRKGILPAIGKYGESAYQFGMSADLVMNADQLIVGRNKTRRAANARARQILGYTDPLPQVGDKLVCLRNNRKESFMNGTLWRVKGVNTEYKGLKDDFFPPAYICDLVSDDDPDDVREGVQLHRETFLEGEIPASSIRLANEFDYGYALTCHKAQGSQWNHVVVMDESSAFRDDKWKWLYTAVTRAAEKVTICRV